MACAELPAASSHPDGEKWPGRLSGFHPGLWLALLVGVALKAVILATGSASFNSDEAILGLMARHILQGELPIFFYGQSYMGALHAYLIAPAFLIFGQTVLAIRLVQLALYLGVLISTYVLAYRLTGEQRGATAAALLIAMPPVMVSVYTTAALGNYVETLLIDNLLLLIGCDLLTGRKRSAGWWLLAGVLGGLGWWGMALIVTTLVPLTLIGLWRFRRSMPWGRVVLLVLGFLIGAAPWLIAIVADPGTILDALLGLGFGRMLAASTGNAGLMSRLLSLVAFNLPALFGLRPPWALEWHVLPLGLFLVTVYLFVVWQAVRQLRSSDEREELRVGLLGLLGGWLTLLVAFVFSPFGNDPTGRYLLPLYPPLAVLVGEWLRWLCGETGRKWLPVALLALIVIYNLWGNVKAIVNDPPGLTTQFNPITHIPNEYDDDLIAFLDSIGADRGYSNYWVAFRLAFLTHERIVLAPSLPYKQDMEYTYGDQRYPPYLEMVRAAPRVVYVTANHPTLDAALRESFAAQGIVWQEEQIGPYTIFYDLPGNVAPEDVVPYSRVGGEEVPSP